MQPDTKKKQISLLKNPMQAHEMLFYFRFQGGQGKAAQYRNPLAAAQRVRGRDRGRVVLLLPLNPGPLSSGMGPSQLSLGCFHEMIPDTILEQIAEQTNRYLR